MPLTERGRSALAAVPRRLLRRWERVRPPLQAALVFVVATPLLAGAHVATFHRLSHRRAIGYALFEGVCVAWLVVNATQEELRHRADRERGDDLG